ncbi:hypothetical protein ACFL5V_05530 [Fibrobacterota bacterium]
MLNKKTSTHIADAGYAVFRAGKEPELLELSSASIATNDKWLRGIPCVIEGLRNVTCLHREISLPFGAVLTHEAVEQNLKECLGQKRNRFGKALWHTYFQEDTKQGTRHRVFISLTDKEQRHANFRSDLSLPVETAVLALAARAGQKTGEQNFQFIMAWRETVFSVLYMGGSPYHLLKVQAPDSEQTLERLKAHTRYLLSGSDRAKPLKVIVFAGEGCELAPAMGRQPDWDVMEASLDLPDAGSPSSGEGERKALYRLMHCGLALAARNPDLILHDRNTPDERLMVTNVRDLSLLVRTTAAAILLILSVTAVFGFKLYSHRNTLHDIKSRAASHEQSLNIIEGKKTERNGLADSLNLFRPLWNRPVAWHKVLGAINRALPEKSGMDGFVVEENRDGAISLQFRTWVSEWDSVTAVQKKLESSPLLSGVALSQQQKKMKKDRVVFHVTALVERF